jgi:hypothetical protein
MKFYEHTTLKNHSQRQWRLQSHKNNFKLPLTHAQLHLRNIFALSRLDLGHGWPKKKTKNSVMIVKPHIDLLHHLPKG